jgi:hypothetical protein
VRVEPSAGTPGSLTGEVRDEANVVVRAVNGCVELTPVVANAPSTIRLADTITVWIEAPVPTELSVRLVSLVDGSLGEAGVVTLSGAQRLHVGVERTTALVTFTAPTLRLCG